MPATTDPLVADEEGPADVAFGDRAPHGGEVREVAVVVLNAEDNARLTNGSGDPRRARHRGGERFLGQDVPGCLGAGDDHFLMEEVRQGKIDEVAGDRSQQFAVLGKTRLRGYRQGLPYLLPVLSHRVGHGHHPNLVCHFLQP